MAREKVEPDVCPVCNLFMGDVDTSEVKDNGTIESHYICSDATECGSSWTIVCRFIAFSDVKDNRPEPAPEPWDVESEASRVENWEEPEPVEEESPSQDGGEATPEDWNTGQEEGWDTGLPHTEPAKDLGVA